MIETQWRVVWADGVQIGKPCLTVAEAQKTLKRMKANYPKRGFRLESRTVETSEWKAEDSDEG